jgi:uncharacterized protein YjbJ (UPF0337 family)
MTTTNESPEMIRQEMEATKSHLLENLECLEARVSETVRSTSKSVSETVDVVHDTVESVSGAAKTAVRQVSDTLNIRRQFDRHPWWFMGGAVVLGYLSVGSRRETEASETHAQHLTAAPRSPSRSSLGRMAASVVSGLETSSKRNLWHQFQDLAIRAAVGAIEEFVAHRRQVASVGNGLGLEEHSFQRSQQMNWDQVEGNWKQFYGRLKAKWGKLTDDDLTTINGKREQLAGLLQARYGYAKERAEKELNEFLNETKP